MGLHGIELEFVEYDQTPFEAMQIWIQLCLNELSLGKPLSILEVSSSERSGVTIHLETKCRAGA